MLSKDTEKLPDDTILEILSFLTPYELVTLSFCSKSWIFSKLSHSNTAWKLVYENYFQYFEQYDESIIKKLEEEKNYRNKVKFLVTDVYSDYFIIQSYLRKKNIQDGKYFINPFFSPKINREMRIFDQLKAMRKFDKNSIYMMIGGEKKIGKKSLGCTWQNKAFPGENENISMYHSGGGKFVPFGDEEYLLVYLCIDLKEKSYNLFFNVVVLCFSLSDKSTFEAIQKWIEFHREYMPGTPIVLVGLKKDLITKESIKNNKSVTLKEVREFMKSCSEILVYIETSAKKLENVQEVFNFACVANDFVHEDYSFFFSNNGMDEKNKKKCIIQ